MNARSLLAVCLLAAPALTRAGPPYATDDPEPVELHHFEVYLAAQAAFAPDGHGGTAPHFELNYGAAPDVQLHLIAPLAWSRAPGGPARYGYGDTEVGAKVRFLHEGTWRPQVGTFVMLELPTGDASRDLGAGHLQLLLPVWLQKSLGPWTTYGGGGYWFNRGAHRRDFWWLGWQMQRTLWSGTSLGAEVFHATAREEGASGETRFNVGLVIDLSPMHHLLLSGGGGLGSPGAQGYLGYQLTFGPKD